MTNTNKSYRLISGTTVLNNTTLTKGQQIRVDLNNTSINEIEELKGLTYIEVTEGHTTGDYTRMYIEITETAKDIKVSMTFNSTVSKTEGCFDYIEREYYTQKTKLREIIFTVKNATKSEAKEYVSNLLEKNKTNIEIEVYSDFSYVKKIEENNIYQIICDVINIDYFDTVAELREEYKELKSQLGVR